MDNQQAEIVRFFTFVTIRGGDECWLWRGSVTHNGYGRFRSGSKNVRAHRYMWEIVGGQPIPRGFLVCHRCDNPRCVRRDHLFVGTQKDNLADRDRKGRGIDGLKNGRAKLTLEAVRAIRSAPKGHGELSKIARAFNISPTHAHRIQLGKNWGAVA